MSADPNTQAKFMRLKAHAQRAQQRAMLAATAQAFERTKALIQRVEEKLAKIPPAYAYITPLTAQFDHAKSVWATAHQRIEAQVSDLSQSLKTQSQQLDSLLQQAETALSTPDSYNPLHKTIDSTATSLEGDADNADRSLQDACQPFITVWQALENHLDAVSATLEQFQTSSIALQSDETLFIGCNAEWVQTGKANDDPDGDLYITNHRLIFEQRETKSKLLGILGSKQVQAELWSVPLTHISEVSTQSKKAATGKAVIALSLSPEAEQRELVLHINTKLGDAYLASLIVGAKRGEFAPVVPKPSTDASQHATPRATPTMTDNAPQKPQSAPTTPPPLKGNGEPIAEEGYEYLEVTRSLNEHTYGAKTEFYISTYSLTQSKTSPVAIGWLDTAGLSDDFIHPKVHQEGWEYLGRNYQMQYFRRKLFVVDQAQDPQEALARLKDNLSTADPQKYLPPDLLQSIVSLYQTFPQEVVSIITPLPRAIKGRVMSGLREQEDTFELLFTLMVEETHADDQLFHHKRLKEKFTSAEHQSRLDKYHSEHLAPKEQARKDAQKAQDQNARLRASFLAQDPLHFARILSESLATWANQAQEGTPAPVVYSPEMEQDFLLALHKDLLTNEKAIFYAANLLAEAKRYHPLLYVVTSGRLTGDALDKAKSQLDALRATHGSHVPLQRGECVMLTKDATIYEHDEPSAKVLGTLAKGTLVVYSYSHMGKHFVTVLENRKAHWLSGFM